MISYLYLVEMRSAAFKKTAARSANGRDSHDSFAFNADSIASVTSDCEAQLYVASGVLCEEGSYCVLVVPEAALMCLPAITRGTSRGDCFLRAVRASLSP